MKYWIGHVGVTACLAVLTLVLSIGYENKVRRESPEGQAEAAGAATLTASADGINGPVEVQVMATQDRIYVVDVLSHSETEGIGTNAVAEIPDAIVEAQSLTIDNVSGAT